jgi:hypothetical protein
VTFQVLVRGLRKVYLVCVARNYTHVIAFRTTAAEHRKLQALRATFPEMGWGETFRWLMEEPAVQEAIATRLAEQPAFRDPVWGLEASLPVGDR